jgi:hypothetical protein
MEIMGSHEKDPPEHPIPCSYCEGKGIITEKDKSRLLEKIRCAECGEIDDNYMVKKETWKEAGLPYKTKRCLKCLLRALKRPLTIQDFTEAPINRALRFGYRLGLLQHLKRLQAIGPIS